LRERKLNNRAGCLITDGPRGKIGGSIKIPTDELPRLRAAFLSLLLQRRWEPRDKVGKQPLKNLA
jgi:hypothetical protein